MARTRPTVRESLLVFVEASCVIDADRETVWRILADAAGYADWAPGMHVDGDIAEGARVRVTTAGGRLAESATDNARVRVSAVRPPEAMTWTGGMPLRLLRGVRTFRLDPAGPGRTRFTMREEMRGPIAWLAMTMPGGGLTTFDRFVAALKDRAEGG